MHNAVTVVAAAEAVAVVFREEAVGEAATRAECRADHPIQGAAVAAATVRLRAAAVEATARPRAAAGVTVHPRAVAIAATARQPAAAGATARRRAAAVGVTARLRAAAAAGVTARPRPRREGATEEAAIVPRRR